MSVTRPGPGVNVNIVKTTLTLILRFTFGIATGLTWPATTRHDAPRLAASCPDPGTAKVTGERLPVNETGKPCAYCDDHDADITRRPTVSTTYLQGEVDFVEGRGTSHRTQLMHAGVAESDLDHDDGRHPLEWLLSLLRSGAVIEGDPAFALHFGQHVPCGQVSIAAPMGLAATNVIEALQQVSRYAPLSIDSSSMAAATDISSTRTAPVSRCTTVGRMMRGRKYRSPTRPLVWGESNRDGGGERECCQPSQPGPAFCASACLRAGYS